MALAVAGLCLCAAAPAGAQQSQVSPIVDHFSGTTVWSEWVAGDRPANDRYFLIASSGGETRRLPVEPRRGVPFDVDLGPGEDGEVVAVYSRCRQEPDVVRVRRRFGSRVFTGPYPAWTAGRGCDVFRFDFGTGQERLVRGASTDQASEMLPSIWRGRIAFARVYEQRSRSRGVYPYLYVRPTTGRATSRRQPGGSRGTNGLPGPVNLDLYGRRLSFAWNYSSAEPQTGRMDGVTELRLDTVRRGHRLLGQTEFSGTTQASYLSPTGSRGRVVFGFQRVRFSGDGPPASVTRLIGRYRISNRSRTYSGAPGRLLVSLAVDDRDVVYGVSDGAWGASRSSRVLRGTAFRYGD